MSEDEREKRYEELRKAAAIYSENKAKRVKLEEFKKCKLAILMKKYEPEHKTAAAQEREARADPEYMEVIEGLASAVELEEASRWKLEEFKMRFEEWRTRNANRRAEMNIR